MNSVMLLIIGYIAVTLKEIPMRAINFIMSRLNYTVFVDTTDWLGYHNMAKYINKLDSDYLRKHRMVDSRGTKGTEDDVTLNYGSYKFLIDKLTLCTINKLEIKTDSRTLGNPIGRSVNVSFIGKNAKRLAIDMCAKLAVDDRMDKYIDVYDGMCGNEVYKKSFDDIFIYDKQNIIEFIDRWVSSKDIYIKHGITYKTGLMLYGTPGTGKSTICRAIASYLNYSIRIMNIAGFDKEQDLKQSIGHIHEKSIVVLEDIDCVLNKADDQRDSIFGMLLNLLDGINSPSEVIFIATTNHIENLDPALLREGRFDYTVNLGDIGEDLASDMCDRFDAPRSILESETFPINPAHLQTKLMKYVTGESQQPKIWTLP